MARKRSKKGRAKKRRCVKVPASILHQPKQSLDARNSMLNVWRRSCYWRAHATMLQSQNDLLRQRIQDVISKHKHVVTNNVRAKKCNLGLGQKSCNKLPFGTCNVGDNCRVLNSNVRVQSSDQMIQFLMKGIKHRRERDAQKRVECGKVKTEPMEIGDDLLDKHQSDKFNMYGAASSKIMAMETAMSINFHYGARHKTHVWPVISIRSSI